MMKAVLKTLAISFGGGLALGAGLRLSQGPSKAQPQPRVDLDPLLGRLKSVENQIVEIEASARAARTAPVPQTAPPSFAVAERTLAAFESRLASQFAEVDRLRTDVQHVEQRLSDLDAHLPVIVQSSVDVRFQEVERKLQQE